MPIPGKSPMLNALEHSLPAECCALSMMTKVAARPGSNQAAIQIPDLRRVAGGKADRDFGRYLSERRQHRNHPQDSERLYARTGRRVGAQNYAIELLQFFCRP